MNQILGSLRGQKVCCIVTSTLVILLFTMYMYIAGSGEQRRIRENGGNKLVEFESHCIV